MSCRIDVQVTDCSAYVWRQLGLSDGGQTFWIEDKQGEGLSQSQLCHLTLCHMGKSLQMNLFPFLSQLLLPSSFHGLHSIRLSGINNTRCHWQGMCTVPGSTINLTCFALHQLSHLILTTLWCLYSQCPVPTIAQKRKIKLHHDAKMCLIPRS